VTAVERKKLIINNIKDKEKDMKKTLTNEKSKQKVLFRYIYRGQMKEKTLDIADIYAIISSKKYEKQVTSLREELIGDTSERELAETDATALARWPIACPRSYPTGATTSKYGCVLW